MFLNTAWYKYLLLSCVYRFGENVGARVEQVGRRLSKAANHVRSFHLDVPHGELHANDGSAINSWESSETTAQISLI